MLRKFWKCYCKSKLKILHSASINSVYLDCLTRLTSPLLSDCLLHILFTFLSSCFLLLLLLFWSVLNQLLDDSLVCLSVIVFWINYILVCPPSQFPCSCPVYLPPLLWTSSESPQPLKCLLPPGEFLSPRSSNFYHPPVKRTQTILSLNLFILQ